MNILDNNLKNWSRFVLTSNQSILCLMGPTASGKTQLSLELAEKYPIEIISVDSAIVYRQLNIGANKPSSEELLACPHHLINIIDVTSHYHVQQFIEDVSKAIVDIQQRGRIPILVGGTMMYFYQLIKGIASIPPLDTNKKEEFSAHFHTTALDQLYEELLVIDPIWAKRISKTDSQRIYRGLEVYWATGSPLSSYFDQQRKATFQYKLLALRFESREDHRALIQKRLDLMLSHGFMDEVEFLWKTYPDESLDFWSFVGYRQLLKVLRKNESLRHAKEKAFFATTQLAKRQRTWLKKFDCTVCPVVINKNYLSSKVCLELAKEHLNNHCLF